MGSHILSRRSILAQSFEDFELIIVDNHSTDDSPHIVESYDDDRIILTRPEEPLHLAQALNHAASMARGEFVARMDADDVSHPSRFEKQVAYLQEHPEVGILGAQICPIDEDGAPITRGQYNKPESHADIACSLFFGCALWHPTVMLRKSLPKITTCGAARSGTHKFTISRKNFWIIGFTQKTTLWRAPGVQSITRTWF
jgi:glycosyltransferase involved in cell wall biosynthesis